MAGILSAYTAAAQDQLGMRMERFAGLYGNTINPANTAFNPNRWEINLFSADVYANNNYGFLGNTGFLKAITHLEDITYVGDTARIGNLPPTAIPQNFSDTDRNLFGIGQFRIAGPGLSFRINNTWTVGLQSAVRGLGSGYGVSNALSFPNLDRTRRFENIQVAPFELAGMGWMEVGLHLSGRFEDNSDIVTAVGITPKVLMGIEGAYAQSQAAFTYQKKERDTLSFNGAVWEYGLTLSDVLGDSVPYYNQPRNNGRGGGFDLGFAWSMPDENGADERDYRWRVGVSVVDIGMVRFNRKALTYKLVTDTIINVPNSLLNGASNSYDFSIRLANAFINDPQGSLLDNAFKVGLPTALSFQFDYKLLPHLYVGGIWVQRIPLYRVPLKRPNVLAVVPRFEHRWASLSVPLVVDDWAGVRLGLAARLAFLTIGSDNLVSLIHKKQFTGTDFYVGLKINGFSLFHFPSGKTHKRKAKGNKQNRRKIKCYTF